MNQANAQLRFMEATYSRFKVLWEKQLISQADYDQALYNYENARGFLSNTRSALAGARVNLGYAVINSPVDGVVLNRAVEEGQTVAASFNTPTLFTIVNDLTRMQVQTSVDEADIGKVKVGQRVEFTVDAYSGATFEASVSEVRLQPVTTSGVVTYVVILNAPNPDKKLMPGMTASATIFIEEKENVLFLSDKALRFVPDSAFMSSMMTHAKIGTEEAGEKGRRAGRGDLPALMDKSAPEVSQNDREKSPGKKKTVWVRHEKYGLRMNMVMTGIDNGASVEIISGLNEGDEVIISMSGGSEKTGQGSHSTEDSKVPPDGMPGHGG
jgi:HlyD family secretion protein